MQQNGAQILISALEAQGVDTIFGYPGGAVLEIYDALKTSNIRHVLVRNEQGGAHAFSHLAVCFEVVCGEEDAKYDDYDYPSYGKEYVLNTNTKKIHKTHCHHINKMNEANKKSYSGSIDDLYSQGYTTCGTCF